MTSPEPADPPAERDSDRFELGVVLGVYVLPLTVTIAFLAAVGLVGLALALLAVEAATSAVVVLVKHGERPGRARAWAIGLGALAAASAALAVVVLGSGA